MSIIDAKETAPWPFVWVNVGSSFWWKKIGDYGNSVFIVIPHKTLVCVGSIGSNDTCTFVWSFGGLITRNNYFMSWLDSKALTCIPLSLYLLDIVIGIFNIFIHIWFTSWPCYDLFLLAICLGSTFFICWWSLTNSSIAGLQSLNADLCNLRLNISDQPLLNFILWFFSCNLLYLFSEVHFGCFFFIFIIAEVKFFVF